jgi:hypothetical protein
MHLRGVRDADRILVLSGIVPAEVALWPIARRGSGTCACSRQFDGLIVQNQLRLRAIRNHSVAKPQRSFGAALAC